MAEQQDLQVAGSIKEHEVEIIKKLFDNSPVLMCLLEGPDHRLVFINKKFRNLYSNRSLKEGVAANQIWPELKGQGKGGMDVFDRMDHVYQTGDGTIVNESEIYFDRKNSGDFEQGYFNFCYQPVKDDEGSTQGLMLTGQEVTERVKARKEKGRLEKRLRLALEGANLGFFEVDAKGRTFNFLSEQAKKHLGYSSDTEVTYEDYFSAIHPDDVPHIQKMARKALDESVLYEVEMRVYWPDGSLHWLLVRGYVITDEMGQPERRIGIAIDITEQKKTEEKLKEAVQIRDDFISIASHELQTPVTSIKTRTELFEMKLRNEGYETFAEEAAKIGEQINQLGDLCNNLLDISKISEGELMLEKEWFSMKKLIGNTLQMLGHVSDHKFISNCKTKGKIHADKFRIEQVLINLLNNAIKYSQESEKIVIEQWEEQDELHVSVTDFGIGITDQEKDKIFKRFYRGEDTDKDTFPGIGVGLYISKEIIMRHGGSLKADNNDGEGTQFTFVLPKH